MASRSRYPKKLFALTIVTAACWLAPRVCLADPGDSDKQAARDLMDRGDLLVQSKDYAEALEAYKAADQIMHVPTTGIEVARMQWQVGLLIEARDAALAVAALPASPDEPGPFAEARASARQLADRLEARIPSIEIHVEGAGEASARVEVDSVVVPARLHGAPRRVNPGSHVVLAIAPGYEDQTRVVSVQDGAHITVTLSMVPGRSSATSDRWLGLPLWGLAGVGTAAGGLALGTITGLVSLGEASHVKGQCVASRCPPSAQGELGAARGMGTASDIFLGLGLVGAGVGVFALVSRPHHGAEKAGSATAASLVMGPGSLQVEGTFR